MKHFLTPLIFFLFFSCSTILFADISDNAELIDAIKKYYEIVDRAKLPYENELRKILATTQKAGNLAGYNAIEAELNHTIGKNGHSITPYEPPKSSPMYSKKAALKRAVDSARIGFKRYAEKLAADLLKEGKINEARDMDTIAKAVEPPRFYIEKQDVPKKENGAGANVADNQNGNIPLTVVYPFTGKELPQLKMVRYFQTMKGRTNQAEWSRDGLIIATSDNEHYVARWNFQTGKLVSTLNPGPGSKGGVLATSNDGKQYFFGGTNEIGLWNPKNNAIVWKKSIENWATNFALSPDGKHLCFCSRFGAFILDASTGRTIQSLNGHKGFLLRAVYFNNGNNLITSSEGRIVNIWDTKTWNIIKRLEGHKEDAYGIAVSPDNNIIATGSYDDTVILWDTKTYKPLRKLGVFKKDVIALSFSPDGKFLAIGQNDGETVIVSADSWLPVATAPGQGVWATKMTWSPDSRFIVTCGDFARVWEIPAF